MHMVFYLPESREKFKVVVDKITIANGCITIMFFAVDEFQDVLNTMQENRDFFINFYIYDAFSHCSIPTIHIEQIFGSPISRNIFMYAYVKDVLDV